MSVLRVILALIGMCNIDFLKVKDPITLPGKKTAFFNALLIYFFHERLYEAQSFYFNHIKLIKFRS